MAKYKVLRPWHGVKAGDVVDIKTLHPSLKAHVLLISGDDVKDTLTPSVVAPVKAPEPPKEPETPPTDEDPDRRKLIKGRLDDLGIQYSGKASTATLEKLLPDGELEDLFPTE